MPLRAATRPTFALAKKSAPFRSLRTYPVIRLTPLGGIAWRATRPVRTARHSDPSTARSPLATPFPRKSACRIRGSIRLSGSRAGGWQRGRPRLEAHPPYLDHVYVDR
jgi:hypothetical protein